MQQEATIGKRVYFQNLDILRFIAAFMVVLSHGFGAFTGWFGLPSFLAGDFPSSLSSVGLLFKTTIENFGFGVDVFFLISGFLITYLLLTEKEITGKINFKNFYIRRTLRIWPLYYLVIALGPWLVSFTHYEGPQANYLANIFFLGNFDAIKHQDWIFPFAHYWSICIEEHFYLVWPFLVAFVPTKKLPPVFCFVIFFSICFRFIMYMSNDSNYFTFYAHTFSRMDALAIGALAAYYHRIKPIEIKISLPVRLMIYTVFIAMLATDHISSFDSLYACIIKRYFYILVAGFAMMNFLFNDKAIFVPAKKNVFHYLGKISYGIYIYHNVLQLVVINRIVPYIEKLNFWKFMGIYLALTIVISIISYELIEKQMLKLKTRFEVIKTIKP